MGQVNGKAIVRLWTERDLRQECPLSSFLFSLYIEEYMMGEQTGRVVVGGKKCLVLVSCSTDKDRRGHIRCYKNVQAEMGLVPNVLK